MTRRLPAKPAAPSIPMYSLYGQIDNAAELRFLHVESLAARNRLHNWDIRPHRHHDLHQIVWVEHGGGEVMLDEKLLTLTAPVLISIPPSIVHGFRWTPESRGLVLTVAESFKVDLARLVGDSAIDASLQQAFVVGMQQEKFDDVRLASAFQTIADEFVYERIGRTTTISGNLLILFAEVVRLKQLHLRDVLAVNAKGGEVYNRFRELIEAHFREHWPISSYAGALAITERSLRRLCVKFANQSPIQIVHRRLLLEAQRNLLYTAMAVAEVGYALGFEDPSYFTRFFVDHAGETPVGFRRSRLSPVASSPVTATGMVPF